MQTDASVRPHSPAPAPRPRHLLLLPTSPQSPSFPQPGSQLSTQHGTAHDQRPSLPPTPPDTPVKLPPAPAREDSPCPDRTEAQPARGGERAEEAPTGAETVEAERADTQIPTADPSTPLSAAPPLYTGSFTLLRELGAGQWSTVSLAQPGPAAPTAASSHSSARALLAIKAPRRGAFGSLRTAQAVLRREAQVLAYLWSGTSSDDADGARSHIVSFFGQHAPSGALVLAAHAETLEARVQCTPAPRDPFTPHIGAAAAFAAAARSLAAALAWVHARGIVHGDVKPGNCLVAPAVAESECANGADGNQPPTTAPPPVSADDTPIHLVLSDFSSARAFGDRSTSPHDAFTLAYAAPEFLAGYLVTGGGVPTAPADVWAAGATLVFAATAHHPYAALPPGPARVAEARRGALLDHAARAPGAARVKRGGLAWRVVRHVLVEAEERVGAEEWVGWLGGELDGALGGDGMA